MLLSIEVGVYRCPKCRKKPNFRTPLAFLGPHQIYVKRCRQKVVEGHVTPAGVTFEVRKTKGFTPVFAQGETQEIEEDIPVSDF